MAPMIELVDTEPSYFEEAIEKLVWVNVMVEEHESILKNNVWEVVPRPEDKSVVGLRWIFKVKHATYKNIEKYKSIFVAKGYSQVEGIDYEETFAPVARYSSIRIIISLAMQMVLLEWLSPLFAPQFVVSPQLLEVPPLELKAPLLLGSKSPSQESITSLSSHQLVHPFTQLSF